MVFPLSHYRLSNFSTPRASLLCGSILLANSTKGLHHDLVSNGTLPLGFSSVEKFSPNWYNESKIVQRAQAYFFEQCHQLVGEIVIRKKLSLYRQLGETYGLTCNEEKGSYNPLSWSSESG